MSVASAGRQRRPRAIRQPCSRRPHRVLAARGTSCQGAGGHLARHAQRGMTSLKLMSWNIQEGGDARLDAIAALIGAQKPDCVALLEVDRLGNAEALASELRMALTYGEANCPSAVAWLTTQPPVKAENHRLPQLAKTLLEIELEWNGAPLRLFATHLGSRWNIQQPADEVVTILQVLERSGVDRHVLAGDMNALRPGDPVGTPPAGEARRGDAVDV